MSFRFRFLSSSGQFRLSSTLYIISACVCIRVYLWYFTSPVCVLCLSMYVCLCVCVWCYIPAGISSQLTDSMFPSSQLCPWVLHVAIPSAMLHSLYKPPPPPLHTHSDNAESGCAYYMYKRSLQHTFSFNRAISFSVTYGSIY